MKRSFLVLIIFLGVSSNSFKCVFARKPIWNLTFIEAKTNFNRAYLSEYTISILPKAPGTILTMKMTVIRNFAKDPMMKIVVLMQTGVTDNGYRQIFTFDFDFCSLVHTNERAKQILDMNVNNVLDIWTSNMRKYGNLPECPVVAGTYSIDNLRADKKSIPAFVMPGKYRIDVLSYFKDTKPLIFFENASIVIELKKN